jgi:hypothetical protein
MSTVTMYKFLVFSLFAAGVVGQMTQAMRDRILQDHNAKRRVSNAANMIELRYDMVLEQVAQNYLARGCAGGFQHNPNRGCDYTSLGGTNGGTGSCASVGENWYSGYPDNTTGVDVVIGGAVSQWTDGTCSSWASPPLRCNSYECSEKENFYQTGSDSYGACSQTSGEVLHFTQVLWATTTHVGCGYTAACGTVCDYAPAGNINLPSMGSIREANLWQIGTPCSACPSGYKNCDAGLCSATSTTTTTTAPSQTTTPPPTTCAADTVNKPTNGNIGTCGSNTAVGSSCAQTCNTGYTLTSGSLTRQCKTGGVWASTTAVCSAITCPADTYNKPTNGNPGSCATSKPYGQTCQMACNAGYTLTSGYLVRTCGSSGSFSSVSAVCSAGTTATPRLPVSTPTPSSASYCTSGPLSTDDSEFGPVTLIGNGNSIIDTTGCPGTIGPLDLTSLSATLVQGQSYTLTLDRTTCGDYYLALIGAWIDWNQDKVWETNELLFPFSTQIGTLSFSFTVPSTATLGKTRMRLQLQEIGSTTTSTIDPCAMFEWGDTKDYSIVVAGASAGLSAQVVAVHVCVSDNVAPINGGLGTCSGVVSLGSTCTQTCNDGFYTKSWNIT